MEREVNWTELLAVRFNGWLGGVRRALLRRTATAGRQRAPRDPPALLRWSAWPERESPTDPRPLSRNPVSLFDLYRTWPRVHHGPLKFLSAGGCRFLLGLEQGSSSSFVSKLLRYSQIAALVRRAVSLESALERHRTC